MFPLRDENPTHRFPILTYTLIAASVLTFLYQSGLSTWELNRLFLENAIVPRLIMRDPYSLEALLDVLRSMFLHGGWAHLLGNMLYLFLFGDNVEDYLGKLMFLVVYFGAGIGAAVAQIMIDPSSPIPMVGASGAIAGVLGSYLVLFPAVRVRGVILLGVFPIFTAFPAWMVLGFWFVTQLFSGYASLGAAASVGGGVAFFAHVGGFVVGMVLTAILMRFVRLPPAERRYQELYQRAGRYPRY